MTRLKRLAAATAALWVAAFGVQLVTMSSAQAAPSASLSIPGAPNASTVSGSISVSLAATAPSSAQLQSADLQIKFGSGAWTCLQHWASINQSQWSNSYTWDTTRWAAAPSQTGPTSTTGCAARSTADLTKNGSYSLRLVVSDTNDLDSNCYPSCVAASSGTWKVANNPHTPAWTSSPQVSGTEYNDPLVTLQFVGSPEPDVQEYHWVREGPDGENEFAVSVANPGGQGCDFDRPSNTYTCYDDASTFPASGWSGTYTYSLIAYRSSPSGSDRCVVPPNDGAVCVESVPSDTQSATLSEPPPSPTGSPSGTGGSPSPGSRGTHHGSTRVLGSQRRSSSGSSGSSYQDFYTGTYNKSLPYGSTPQYSYHGSTQTPNASPSTIAAGSGQPITENARRLWQSIAGGMALLLGAAHMSRMLRRL
ncbi:MAG: hypothetical protein LC663_01570 [Actinobacteria bacterium]|nr:hypothetical protein [Actinomycetota bacterium]